MSNEINIIEPTGTFVSSLPTESFDDKRRVLALLSGDATPLNTALETELGLADYIIQPIMLTNEDGNVVSATRTILLSDVGDLYTTVSDGVARAVRDIVTVLGDPSQWPNRRLPVRAVERRGRSGYRYMTLEVV